MQAWLPASLSVIPNTAFLQRVSTPLADVTAWYSPRFRAGRDEMSACVKSIGVAIARGRARLLVRAATGRALWGSGGRKGRQGKDAKRPSPLSTEWDQHSC